MKSGRRWWQVGAAIAGAILSEACAAQTGTHHADGRAIYQGFVPFAAGIDATSLRMPQRFVACASCHGVTGDGRREGSVVAPPLSWATLFNKRGRLAPFADKDEVVRAITLGAGRNGGMLSAAMPRYRLSSDETSAILSYLTRVGGADDNPPGVTPLTVHLAAILPLSGQNGSIGLLVRRGLEEVFDEVNRSGGIHGRTLDITVFDAAIGQETLNARVIASAPYAVVGGMWRTASLTMDNVLAQQRISKIATLIPRATAADLDAWDADLLPPLDVQQSVLVKTLSQCTLQGARLGIPIAVGVSRDDGKLMQWFDGATDLLAARDLSHGGCIAAGLATSASLRGSDPANWEQRIVLPFPARLLQLPDLWLTLGQVAARLTIELLSRSGARLHEASLLDAARLRDVEPIAHAPIRFSRSRRYGWDADVFVPAAEPADRNLTISKDLN